MAHRLLDGHDCAARGRGRVERGRADADLAYRGADAGEGLTLRRAAILALALAAVTAGPAGAGNEGSEKAGLGLGKLAEGALVCGIPDEETKQALNMLAGIAEHACGKDYNNRALDGAASFDAWAARDKNEACGSTRRLIDGLVQ